LRVAFLPTAGLMAFGVTQHRGWVLGLVAAVVYGAMGLAVAVNPGRVTRWSREHPEVDGAILGPLVLLALAVLTSWSVWWCLLIAGGSMILGASLGRRRRKSSG
jgi:hypothetical protein